MVLTEESGISFVVCTRYLVLKFWNNLHSFVGVGSNSSGLVDLLLPKFKDYQIDSIAATATSPDSSDGKPPLTPNGKPAEKPEAPGIDYKFSALRHKTAAGHFLIQL